MSTPASPCSGDGFNFAEAGKAATSEKKASRWADESEALSPEFLPSSALDRADRGGQVPSDDFVLDGFDDHQDLPEGPSTVFIGNLSYDCSKHALRRFFEEKGVVVTDVRLITDTEGAVKGFGYVELADQDSLRKALKCNGSSFQKRTLRVDIADAKAKGPRGGRGSDWDRPRRDDRRDGRDRREDRRDDRRDRYEDRRDDRKGGKRDDKGRGKGRDEERKGKGRWEERSEDRDFRPRDREPREAAKETPEAPAVRPKLLLSKRTKPLDEVGLPQAGEARIGGDGAKDVVGPKSDPFGGARARDEKKFDETDSGPSTMSTPAAVERAPKAWGQASRWEEKGAQTPTNRWDKRGKGEWDGGKEKGEKKGKGRKKGEWEKRFDPPTDFERYPIPGVGRGARLEAMR